MHPSVDNYDLKKRGLPEHDGPSWMRLTAPQRGPKSNYEVDEAKEAEREARNAKIAAEAAERKRIKAIAHERELAERKAKRDAEKAEMARISRQRQKDRRAGRKVAPSPGKTGMTFGQEKKEKTKAPKKRTSPASRALPGEITTPEARAYIESLGQHRSSAAVCHAIQEGRLKATRRGKKFYTTKADVDAYLAATKAVRQAQAIAVGKARAEKARAKKSDPATWPKMLKRNKKTAA